MKNCRVCLVDLTDKNTKPYRLKNYVYLCNDCDRKQKREQALKSRQASPSSTRARSAKYNKNLKEKDPVKYSCKQMSASSRKRALAYSLDRDIDTEFLISIAPTHCPVLGFELKYGGGDKKKNSCSLDRIDSNLGYVKSNVQIISNLANLMKSNATKEEMINFSKWVLGKFNEVDR